LVQAPGLPPLLPFAAPNTPDARLEALGRLPAPFLYAVSVLGVTGTRNALDPDVPAFLARARSRSGLPVLAGFGLSSAEQAAALAPACGGVILGSALAKVLEGAEPARLVETARDFLRPFRAALDSLEVPCC
jgi:tryptophan synthase alpha subunit